jgi:hypothetical protein
MTEQILRTAGRYTATGPAVQGSPVSRRGEAPAVWSYDRPAIRPGPGTPARPDHRAGADPEATLSRLWLEALADETRHVAPLERMATALVVFASAVSLLLASGTASRLVEGWDAFAAFVQGLIL